MNVEEAAAALGCSPGLVYKLCAEGRLGYSRLGFGRGKILIEPAELEKYRDSVRVLPVPAGGGKPKAGKRPAVKDYVGEWERKRRRG